MKKILFKLFALIMVVALIQSCNEPLIEDQNADELELKSASSAKKSYIVVLNDDDLNTELVKSKGYEKKQAVVKAKSAKILKRAGITDGEIGFVYGTAIKGFSVKIAPRQLKKLQDDPSVKYIEEDQIITLIQPDVRIKKKPVPAPPIIPKQTIPWGITRVNSEISTDGETNYSGNNVAWIIDTGIDFNHPDLNVDISRDTTFVPRTESADDDNGHGTHCAGIIGAINDSIGVIGVAAGATVVPVKVLNKRGSGTISGVIAGVNYVGGKGVTGDVANMSLGGSISVALDSAVVKAARVSGVKFVLAAGNEDDDANNHSPARANGINVYTISAMDSTNTFAYFSNHGNPPIDYCEPGVSIYSCYKDGGYATMSGTSMAAPHAAGLLLLGNIRNVDTVIGDPDGNADPIGVH